MLVSLDKTARAEFEDMAGLRELLAMGKFIASHLDRTNAVSHELRTPVSRLRFGLAMMKNAARPTDREPHLAGLLCDVDEIDELVAELFDPSPPGVAAYASVALAAGGGGERPPASWVGRWPTCCATRSATP
jgi:hypothetical protein